MPKQLLETFDKNFWKLYQEKNFTQIIDEIPKLLKNEHWLENTHMYHKLCVFSIIVIVREANKNPVAVTYLESICNKFDGIIERTHDPFEAAEFFICVEYLLSLTDIPEAALRRLIDHVAPAVLNKLTNVKDKWKEKGIMTLNRFIVVLVELESKMSSCEQWSPSFTTVREAIKLFSTITKDERKTAYPEYLLAALTVIESYREQSVEHLDELMQVKSLVKNKSGRDVAIMVSQVICAAKLLISKGSALYKQIIYVILNDLYDIVRNKSLSMCKYKVQRTYESKCCIKEYFHVGIQIMQTIRSMFVEAMKDGSFNLVVVSVMSNYAVLEAEIISHTECKERDRLKYNLAETFRYVRQNIRKIVTVCGLDRAKRTLEKFLGVQSDRGECGVILNELLNICKGTDNKAEKISWLAMRLMFATDRKWLMSDMCQIHKIQAEFVDPKQVETIWAIVSKLPKKKYLVKLDPVQLQLLQISNLIEYQQLPAMCLQKLVQDIIAMDFYKNNNSYSATLCRSGVCCLQFIAYCKRYKSNVKYDKTFDPLNEKFVLLKREVEIVEKLKEALDCLATFIRDEDAWKGDTDCILLAEKLLQFIGETLINRHYKELAVIAFDLFRKFAKIIDRPLSQMIAAGYVVENIQLAPTIPEKELVTELQTLVMQKLRHVDSMTDDELGSFLLGFLQLTTYTMRYQHNIDHAKKFMQAINKLLNKYDKEKAKFLAARLKYAETMFELIVKNTDTTITPVTFIEDIFHRFKSIRLATRLDQHTIPGIILDLLTTLHEFTQPRYELRYTSPLHFTINCAAIRNGYLFVLAKSAIFASSKTLLTQGKNLEEHIKQLDVLFDCSCTETPSQTEKTAATWNEDISPLIHPTDCKCSQCSNKYLNTLAMDVATLKASTVYFKKHYAKSLATFKRIYNHWTAYNTSSYSSMLMYYSNCLISNDRQEKSNAILNEALEVCNDYAQAQDISVRLLLNAKQNELKNVPEVKSYASDGRRNGVRAVKSKKKVNSKPSLPANIETKLKTYPKRTNLRN